MRVSAWVLFVLLLVGFASAQQTIGSFEQVEINGANYLAKIDTGADASSIDETLASTLGLEPIPGRSVLVESTFGLVERPVVEATFVLGNSSITTVLSLTDRSGVEGSVLIGKADLNGFVVDPSRREILSPSDSPTIVSDGFSFSDDLRYLLIIPILSSIIILIHILLGFQTFGVFGPLVIALSLLQSDILMGISAYFLLVLLGLAFILLIKRFRMPLICEISLLMFFLCSVLFAVNSYVSFFDFLFPVIITSFLVERFSQQIEVRALGHGLLLIMTTLGTALLMAYLGAFLFEVSFTVLLVVAAVALILVVALSRYVGLRLTELLRFKFVGGR